MSIFDDIKEKVVGSVWKDDEPQKGVEIDNKIALGVLLWAVADADDKFLPEEEEKLKEVLKTYIQINENDMGIVLNTIEIAAIEKIDLHRFTREVGQNLPYDLKCTIMDNLFRIACADQDLAHQEIEMIRKISGLLKIDHKDFISAKIKIKKEFGMDTAGL